jgi:hypothetical protein
VERASGIKWFNSILSYHIHSAICLYYPTPKPQWHKNIQSKGRIKMKNSHEMEPNMWVQKGIELHYRYFFFFFLLLFNKIVTSIIRYLLSAVSRYNTSLRISTDTAKNLSYNEIRDLPPSSVHFIHYLFISQYDSSSSSFFVLLLLLSPSLQWALWFSQCQQ